MKAYTRLLLKTHYNDGLTITVTFILFFFPTSLSSLKML